MHSYDNLEQTIDFIFKQSVVSQYNVYVGNLNILYCYHNSIVVNRFGVLLNSIISLTPKAMCNEMQGICPSL